MHLCSELSQCTPLFAHTNFTDRILILGVHIVKEDSPTDEEELVAFTEKLFTFGVSINKAFAPSRQMIEELQTFLRSTPLSGTLQACMYGGLRMG